MGVERFYRINIKFLEPDKLSLGFRTRFQNELNSDAIYLGIRFKPTNYTGSAAINSLELAHQCMDLAKQWLLDDYGKIDCTLREFPCSSNFMQSIIDADTRTLMNYIQDKKFTSQANGASLPQVRNISG